MPHNTRTLPLIRRIAAKEISLFFASPTAYLFLATFAAVTLFVFFWGEAFFSRNIADVRPLFEWMPILLIFLASTLTMRLWSEERRTGTLEHVLTQPVPLWHFVVGKFVGCLVLLAIALLITVPLPISVSLFAELDWGPVWAGYLATFLLGAAYLSIGLFVSARSDNQIVSLISATALCSIFYLLGTPTITHFFDNQVGELFRLLGTGSRFDAITRGVIDLRDLYFYVSIIAVFLALNTFALEKQRWANHQSTAHHRNWRIVTLLLIANVIGANIWLAHINTLRMDTTAGQQYSISDATHNYLAQLQEPLLLRGYFSSKTHPLLSPLVPQLKDLMREYEIAGQGKVRVEFIDPATEPELEDEANKKYGIQPVPFQVADRYQSSIVSSYFNVLVQYGDEFQVLGFRDLIEMQSRTEANVDVQLRNPEHDLTRAVKKVLNSYQGAGNLFDTVRGNLTFTAYISAEAVLPEQLQVFKKTVTESVKTMQSDAKGQLSIELIDPDADGGQVAQKIADELGFKPMATSLQSDEHFYFYMTVSRGDQVIQIPLDDLTAENFDRNLKAGIKRFASGFTRTISLVLPKPPPAPPQFNGMQMPPMPGPQFNALEAFLSTELNVVREDLSDGRVSGESDLLLLVAPKDLDEKELFAVDQFLMQGGTVIVATSPFSASFANRSLVMQKQNSGIASWLAHHGLSLGGQLVLDPQNAAFPIPVTRNVGGFQLQDIRMLDYPYFIDIRSDGLNRDTAITADLPQLTMSWASPILVNKEKQAERQIIELLHSTDHSWLSGETDVMPQVTEDGIKPFEPSGEQGKQLLGVVSTGRFSSFFADKPSPLLANASTAETVDQNKNSLIAGSIKHSPESAKIILFSATDFLRDQVVRLMGTASGTQYLNSLQLIANTVDWSLEDSGLLSIRARGHFNRTLPPMSHDAQLFWEYLNYVLVIILLGFIALLRRWHKKAREKVYIQQLSDQGAAS